MVRVVLAVVAALAIGGTAAAEETPGPSDNARYTFHRMQDGFLRLDTRSGRASHCRWEKDGWFCRAVPDERRALEREIERLMAANAALKNELLSRGLPLPEGIRPDPPVSVRSEPALPTQAELDRVITVMEKVWRRIIEMMANLQRDMLRKG